MSGFDLLGSLGARAPSGTPGAGTGATPPQPSGTPCSRKGCRADAAWALSWRNPKIHGEDRRKVWLACHEHREWLSEYLGTRGFLLDVEPFTSPSTEPGRHGAGE